MKTLKQIEYQLQADAPYNLGSSKEIGYGCGVDSALNHPQIVLAVNMHEELIQALKDLTKEVNLGKLNIRKDFSLISAHASALKAIFRAEDK